VVFKPTHRTLKFDSFNHHQYHHQAHSSSKKYVHLNHLHHHLSAFVNKHQLFQRHHHLFSVRDHHNHQLLLLLKLSFDDYPLYQFHHDQSSSNDFQLSHHDHVILSSNDGFHMEHKLNDAPLFNVLQLHKGTLNHAMSLFNMNQFKFVLFDNSNVLVLFKLIHKLMFNNMVFTFLMPMYFFNKLVLLVLLKIFQLQLLVVL